MLCLASALSQASLWNGIDVVDFLHVSGRGGPQDLKGIWSEPLNAQTNTLCSLETDDPKLRCPAACAKTHAVSKKRVRHAIHKMSDAEWRDVHIVHMISGYAVQRMPTFLQQRMEAYDE